MEGMEAAGVEKLMRVLIYLLAHLFGVKKSGLQLLCLLLNSPSACAVPGPGCVSHLDEEPQLLMVVLIPPSSEAVRTDMGLSLSS